jgi:hypothetical protein
VYGAKVQSHVSYRHLNNFPDPGIVKLNNFTGIDINKVIVLFAGESFFELGYILAKLVPNQ